MKQPGSTKGVKLHNVYLTSSHFEIIGAEEIEEESEKGISVVVDTTTTDANPFFVKLTATVNLPVDEKNTLFSIEASYTGVFEFLDDDSEVQKETFAKVNAPAIIFPFVREHIANISQKAGNVIWIPPMNFIGTAED